MKIILLGYMASGKSTVLKELSKKFKINAIDLDDYITDKEGDTIVNIFKNKGEIYFRKQENRYLAELLKSSNDFVLALGGGTPCYANNMELITRLSTSIYLKANLKTLFNRLQNEKDSRPLITDLTDEKLQEYIAKHLFERGIFYEQALYQISIDDKSIEDIVEDINRLLLKL